MANIFDVAKYILDTIGEVSTMKLQKLCYYSQVINIKDHDEPIFDEDFEAWANGPVSRELFDLHKGKFVINSLSIKKDKLTNTITSRDLMSIEKCLDHYGRMDAAALSELSHKEDPWKNARKDTFEGQKCSNKISKRSIREYYS
jgi:uncharacterized phage-associated protein